LGGDGKSKRINKEKRKGFYKTFENVRFRDFFDSCLWIFKRRFSANDIFNWIRECNIIFILSEVGKIKELLIGK
jgi:hypothetical protein